MGKKILIVEDDPEIAEAVKGVLESEGYGVAKAATAEEGLTYADDETIDLVLLDIILPDKEGTTVLERFCSARPQLPVIMMTGVNDVKRAVECMKLGARDYLRKPFPRVDLLESIEYEIGRAAYFDSSDGVVPFEEEEKRIISNALTATGWRVNEAAKQLKIGRATIYRKIERYGLSRPKNNN